MAAVAIASNLDRVHERIARAAARAGRRAEDIALVAVTKTFPVEAIHQAYAAGVRHFGENRVQEWESKQPLIADLDATWHLVGHLQSNKAARAARLFHTIDSVGSLGLARHLDRACSPGLALQGGASPAPATGERLGVLIEVRLAPEETKTGVEPEALEPLAREILTLPHLDLRGLMCIPPYFEDSERARPYFRRLRELRDSLRAHFRRAEPRHSEGTSAPEETLFPELSMGMSHDFEVAIEEGATQVRLGTAIFGERSSPR